jgi:hypothetical protein
MNQLMSEIRTYADLVGVSPSTVLQRAGAGSGTTWSRWEAGRSCTLNTADKLREWMVDNPPAEDAA